VFHFFSLRKFVHTTKLYFSDIYVLLVRIPGYLFIIQSLLLKKLNYKLNKPEQIFSEEAYFLRRVEFYPRLGHVRILVDSVAQGQVFLKVYDMIYLTAIGLPPGGSSTVHIYTQTIHITTHSTQTIHRTTQT
jgi:hypothetical protein